MNFNPDSKRKYFTEGGLDLVLNAKFDSSRPMGNVAQHLLADVIRAWLVGLSGEVAPALPRILEWLDFGISTKEDFGSSAHLHQMNLTWAKGLALWMLTGDAAVDVWGQARDLNAAALAEGTAFEDAEIPTERLDDYMAFCFQSRAYDMGLSEFKKFHAVPTLSTARALKPRHIGYFLCVEQLGVQVASDSLFDAATKMLSAHLQTDWLGRGQMLRAATWLKIVHWHRKSTLNPLAAVLHAYDNMPKIPRPT